MKLVFLVSKTRILHHPTETDIKTKRQKLTSNKHYLGVNRQNVVEISFYLTFDSLKLGGPK